MDGSSLMHLVASISATNPTKLAIRDLSCFCGPCQVMDWESCENSAHVSSWHLIILKTAILWIACGQMAHEGDGQDSQYGKDGASLANLLEIGDNFALPAQSGNLEGVQFYLLKCIHLKYIVSSQFTCKWGHEFQPGDNVVSGYYYQP